VGEPGDTLRPPACCVSDPFAGIQIGLDEATGLVPDLPAFSSLVRDLRATESRRSTVRDTPILAAVNRPIAEIIDLLGAAEETQDAGRYVLPERNELHAATAGPDNRRP
jgi:hypothetical protein